jgi:A/G-specific adenine glycosylase
VDELAALPGIGRATASAIVAFAFNQPSVFIETNIRRVFIHYFFKDENNVEDARLLPLVQQTLDTAHPREWYYALMDYGVMLKKTHPNPNRRSAHYQKQAPFHGSNRQLRGMVLRTLVKKSEITLSTLTKEIGVASDRLAKCLHELQEEGFIKKDGRRLRLA